MFQAEPYARSGIINTLNPAANPTFLDAAANIVVTDVIEPSYVSGSHHWKGTTPILKPIPATTRRSPIITIGVKLTFKPAPKVTIADKIR